MAPNSKYSKKPSSSIRTISNNIRMDNGEEMGHYEDEEMNEHKQEDLNEPIMLTMNNSKSSLSSTSMMFSSSLNYLLKDEEGAKEDERAEYYEEEEGINNDKVDNLDEDDEHHHEQKEHLPTITDIVQEDEDNGEELKKKNFVLACWDSFTHSQFYVHMLMFSTLMTFGGFCVLAPNPIRTMRPTIFAFIRSSLMVICYFILSLIVDRDYSFRSQRFLSRIKNPILRYLYKKTPSFKDFKRMVLCGSMYMLNMVLFVIGMKMINATIAAIVQPLVAVEVCLISIFLGREASSIVKILGVVISAIGAMAMLIIPSLTKEKAVATETQDSGSSMLEAFSFAIGMIILILNTVAYAFYLILLKKLLNKKIPGITLNFWTFLGGLFIPFLAALYNIRDFEIRRLDDMSYIGMAYAVLIHGTFSFILSSKASSLTSPTVIGIYSTISPTVTTAMTVLISGEEVSLWIIPGALGIFLGVIMVILAKWREGKAAAAKAQATAAAEKNETTTSTELEDVNSIDMTTTDKETQEEDK